MKAILIVDMPVTCRRGCPCYDAEYEPYCRAGNDNGCPLKPMPEKKVSFYDIDIHEYDKSVDGWNACIDAILEPNSANGEAE